MKEANGGKKMGYGQNINVVRTYLPSAIRARGGPPTAVSHWGIPQFLAAKWLWVRGRFNIPSH